MKSPHLNIKRPLTTFAFKKACVCVCVEKKRDWKLLRTTFEYLPSSLQYNQHPQMEKKQMGDCRGITRTKSQKSEQEETFNVFLFLGILTFLQSPSKRIPRNGIAAAISLTLSSRSSTRSEARTNCITGRKESYLPNTIKTPHNFYLEKITTERRD